MGERTILVCDVCGRAANETVTIRVGRRNYAKDLCTTHLSELTAGARRPRPGRRRGSVGATTAAKKTTAKKATGKRRGRPPKAKSSSR